MQLIADSGSTKTNWRLITVQGETVSDIFTAGINPFYMSGDEICHAVSQFVVPYFTDYEINKIFFYGAGCSFPEKRNIVENALLKNFPLAGIEVEKDLLGTARSLFGSNSGIACILGTGSNSCLYSGGRIIQNVSPLGYILGDEGSGAVLGRMLIADVLKNRMPETLIKKFFEKYDTDPQQIMENVYRKSFPNRYLAGFAPFLSEHISHESIYRIVYGGFDDFFKRNIMQYPANGCRIGFTGSVAAAFAEILMQVAQNYSLEISEIKPTPMNGLAIFHSRVF